MAAHALRQELALGHGWVDPFAALRQRGVVLVRHAVKDEGDLDGNYRLVDDQAFVFVNSSRPAVRQRFTAAHELGHHELDVASVRANIVDADVYGVQGTHRDMNFFAAAFLIDQAGACQMRDEGLAGEALVAATIARFEVSFKAAAIELKYLHLITTQQYDDLVARHADEEFRVGEFVAQFGHTMPTGPSVSEELDPSFLAMVKRRYERGGLNLTAVAAALRTSMQGAQGWLEEAGAKGPAVVQDDGGFYLPE
jgi:Zn-dependent peptidase ImmA (M78 family)